MFSSLLNSVKPKKHEEPQPQALAEDVQILLIQLDHIHELALKKNTYQLDSTEKKNLTITLNSLIFLVKHLDDETRHFATRRDVCHESPAPIHFDTLPIREYNAELRRNFLIEQYVDPFIDSFNNVVSASDIRQKNFVKVFCSRLFGNCFEMRTRKAFLFGSKLKTNAPNWNERYTNAKYCLETYALDGNKDLIINSKKPPIEEPKELTPAVNYDNYLAIPENQNTLIALTMRFFGEDEDDFDLTIQENRDLAQNIIKHLCHTKPESAGIILYKNIHKKNKEILIDWLIENNANLNYEEKIEDKVINTFHRAICHGASKQLVSNLIDYGATIRNDMINETLTAALKYCAVDSIQVLITEYAHYASSLHTYLDYSKSIKEDKKTIEAKEKEDKKTTEVKEFVLVITDQKVVDAVEYHSAKLKLLQAMVQAQSEGCEFHYSKAEKSFYLAHLVAQLQTYQSISECFHLFRMNIDSIILNYERIINRSTFTFKSTETFTSSTQQFIQATQERIFQLLSSKAAKALTADEKQKLTAEEKHQHTQQLISNYYEIQAAMSHSLAVQAIYTPKEYEEKLLSLYRKVKEELFETDQNGNFVTFNPKDAAALLTNTHVVSGLHKEIGKDSTYLMQVFKFMRANINKFPDTLLTDIYKCMRNTGLFHEDSIRGLQKQFMEARHPKPPMANNGSSLLMGNATSQYKTPPNQNGHFITVAPPVSANVPPKIEPKKLAVRDDNEVKIDPVTKRPVLPPNAQPLKLKDQPSAKPIATKATSNGTHSSHTEIQSLLKVKCDVSKDGDVKVTLLIRKNPAQQAQANKSNIVKTNTQPATQNGTKAEKLPSTNGNTIPVSSKVLPPLPLVSFANNNSNAESETFFGSQPKINYFETLDTLELAETTPTRYRHNPNKKK